MTLAQCLLGCSLACVWVKDTYTGKDSEVLRDHDLPIPRVQALVFTGLPVIPQTFNKVKTLAEVIISAYLNEDFRSELAMTRAKQDVQSFEDEDYVDLRHLMELLQLDGFPE